MARSFNGTSDVITVPAVSLLSPAAVTMSVWVNPITINANAYQLICGDCDSGSTNYQVFIKSTGKLAWYNTALAGVNIDPGTNSVSAGTWYNLVVTYDSTNGLKTFVNNVSDGTVAANGALNSTARTFLIGNQTGLTRFANIAVADIGVWNLALSAGEISALSKGARPYTVRSANLIGYWPLPGLASPEPDLSGNNNNGTLTGTVLATSGPPTMQFTSRWPQRNLPDSAAAPTILLPGQFTTSFAQRVSAVGY